LIDPLTDPTTGFHRRLEEVFHLEPDHLQDGAREA
jgi:hypothetical protein